MPKCGFPALRVTHLLVPLSYMEPSKNSDLQQMSTYSADCIIDVLRIVVAVLHIGIVLAPIFGIIFSLVWWKKVHGKARKVGVAIILASTAFVCVCGWFVSALFDERLALLRSAQTEIKSFPQMPAR